MTTHPVTTAPPLSLTDDLVDDLGADLDGAGYDATGVPSLLGPSANAALGRGEFWPALRVTAARPGPLGTLTRLLLLGTTEPPAEVAAALPRTGTARALAAGLLERDGDGLRSGLDVRPHSDDLVQARPGVRDGFLVVSDLDSDTRPGPVRHEHVLGIGQASLSLARATVRRPVDTALDIGTGCGIQSLHLSRHAGSVVATDTNPRALQLAAATARLNGLTVDLRAGSLYEPVAGERFDLIVSNPPFVIGDGEQQYVYRDSGMAGDAVCRQLVEGAADHLRPGGVLQLLANWTIATDEDWRSRVAGWVEGTGLDGWVVQRERADPVEYVSLWLQDAGEDAAATARRGAAWLDWFDSTGTSAIGMGVVTLRRRLPGERGPADLVLDELTEPGHEVTGQEADDLLQRRRLLTTLDDDALLDLPLRLHPEVVLEERSVTGHQGWSTVLRMAVRAGGPGATLQVDEWGRALLAGCRGEAPLRLVVELLAAVHDLDEAALTAAVLPSIRVAVGRGLLLPPPSGAR